MKLLLILFVCLLLFALFRLYHYILFRLGYKDSKYPIVQHLTRKAKPKDTSEAFLPGSRMNIELDEAMTGQLKVQGLEEEKKKKQGLPFTKQELKHAILLEDLLHPKFKEEEHQSHSKNPDHGDEFLH
ncbi:MAG: hypothetical protein D6730_10300 [Bacteroidetes bacterium]|nr:MAG: hypothetical protein D6730_10300 [Bacteroidota bacterium]